MHGNALSSFRAPHGNALSDSRQAPVCERRHTHGGARRARPRPRVREATHTRGGRGGKEQLIRIGTKQRNSSAATTSFVFFFLLLFFLFVLFVCFCCVGGQLIRVSVCCAPSCAVAWSDYIGLVLEPGTLITHDNAAPEQDGKHMQGHTCKQQCVARATHANSNVWP